MSEDRPAISTPRISVTDIARKSFGTVRRGFDPEEVRLFLEAVAEELAAAEQREDELHRELAAAEEQVLHPDIDEATLSAALGQRSAAVLRSAHEEAGRIVDQAESHAAALLRDAHQQATEAQVQAEAAAAERIADAEITANSLQQQARQEAAQRLEEVRAEADAIIERAREQGRAMLDQAQEARRRVLADMAQRRRAMTAQIDQYRAARDEVAAAVVGVRHSVDRIVGDLARADDAARVAAAEVAHRHPVETTERILVAEAEQAAADLGARTGSAADLEASRPVSIDEIRTEVPHRREVSTDVAAWGAATGSAGAEEGEPGEEAWGTVASGGDAETEAFAEGASPFVFEDLGAPDAAYAGTALPASGLPPVPGAEELFGYRDEWEDRPEVEAGEGVERGEPGGTVPGGTAPDQVVATGGAGASTASAEEAASSEGDHGLAGGEEAAAGAPPVSASEPADDDSVEGLFARLRASRATTDRPAGRPGPAANAAGTGGEEADERGRVSTSEAGGEQAGARAPQSGGRGADTLSGTPGDGVATPAATATDDADGERVAGDGDEEDDGEPPRSVATTPAAERALARRAELLDPVTAVLTRRLKRALQDDQNHLLERLRSGTGEWTDDLLTPEDEQRVLYTDAALPHVRDAVAAGIAYARSVGRRARGKAPAPDDETVAEVAGELGGTVVTLLRRRLSGDGVADPVERVGAAYREWRGERIERLVGDSALEAFSAGVLAALPSGSGLRWVRNEATLGCADCEDNALGEAVPSGEEFPTGHLHPPAHPGCRCLVLPTPT